MAKAGKRRTRATVLCWHDGRLLLVRRKGGKWNFPGGALVSGEGPGQAAARELVEETGLRSHGLLPLCTLQAGDILHHVFSTQLLNGDRAAPDNEIAACKWVTREQLGHLPLKRTAAALLARELPALLMH